MALSQKTSKDQLMTNAIAFSHCLGANIGGKGRLIAQHQNSIADVQNSHVTHKAPTRGLIIVLL